MILEKTIKAKELPEALRTGIDPDSFVRISIQRVTENGFTEEFEQGVLEAERDMDASNSPAMPDKEFIKLLKSWI